jgi:tetratricopeptide (TPR) repeat protein
VFDVFLKTRNKVGGGTQAGSSEASSSKTPSAADKEQAEKFKKDGNSLMSAKNFDAAIEAYNKAVALDPTNPIYYSNRAAAYSSKGDHLAAVGDAEEAIKVDPKFTKAYHRLGYVVVLAEYHPEAYISNQSCSVLPWRFSRSCKRLRTWTQDRSKQCRPTIWTRKFPKPNSA